MNKRQLKLLELISKQAIITDWEIAFNGKSYGNKHLFRVQKISNYIQNREGGDLFVVLAGAWVHDVSLAYGSDYDPIMVEKRTKEFLKKINGLSKDEVQKIIDCAVAHEGGQNKLSLEAMIVHDADVIDKSGCLGIIRHIWKMTNMLENRILHTEYDLKKLKIHLSQRHKQIFTNTAKELSSLLNHNEKEFFKAENKPKETMTEISKLAKKGEISDSIALLLCSNHKNKIFRFLKMQLNCSYLN